jgi:hypothetical protein
MRADGTPMSRDVRPLMTMGRQLGRRFSVLDF